MKLPKFFKRKPAAEAAKPAKRRGLPEHPLGKKVRNLFVMPEFVQPHGAPGVSSDSADIGPAPSPKPGMSIGANEAQLGFFAVGSHFIGYQVCAMLATNWLIDKACGMPARDAVRKGYLLTCGSDEVSESLRDSDGRFKVTQNLREMIHFGRVYGGRIVLFEVRTENPDEYYKNPFNLDGVAPGSYMGMSQIDPNWVTPELTEDNLSDPASQSYYEPTYWRIKDRVYHKSHLRIFVPYPVPDFLKPTYRFMGVSVPQRMMERAYCAERSANEGPQLLMTKRLTSISVSDDALANRENLEESLAAWASIRDNYGVKVGGADETIQQFDTALGDVDAVIMTQFQLAASVANVPATKLLGTQPKGFNATGDYEHAVYREDLESIQANDMSPLLERHYALVAKSHSIDLPSKISIQWLPLDSPTGKESAEIEKIKADRDAVLIGTGAIDAADIRERVRNDRDNDYHNIEAAEFTDGEENANQTPPAVGPGAPGAAI
ncbi:portal protein [Bordetella phage vB_BaM-IFTN5]|nr:portal protein [Bordetella phage vB_BaM-IFTN5]